VAGLPDIRAGLIALAIGLGLVEGCPLPAPEHTPAWKRGFVEPIRSAQRIVLTPVAWIGSTLRVSQQWSLYQAPSVDRFRLTVEGQDATGHWHLLFRAGDPDHAEDGELIDYTRPRGAWDPTTRPPLQYPLFARWMTQRVLDRHPEFTSARVQLEQVELSASGVLGTKRFVYPHIRPRSGRP
jgi:hypothetical protein